MAAASMAGEFQEEDVTAGRLEAAEEERAAARAVGTEAD